MKKIKNEDFANALKAIRNKENGLLNNHEVLSKEYDGYVSSLGASIINSCLLPNPFFLYRYS